MFIAKRIVVLLCLCLMLAGCGGGDLTPFEGTWREEITGLTMTVNSNGSYSMTDNEGTETGRVWHDKGDWYVFKIETGKDTGVENKFKLTVEGNVLSLEVADGTVLTFNRVS